MGFSEVFTDFCAAFSTPEVHADAPPEDEEKDEGGEEESKDEGEGQEEGGEEGGDEEGGEEEGGDEAEEEEEEEEEPEDPKPKLEAECARSAQCAPLKHHFDECAERVHEQQENPDHKGPKEDCVEECEHNVF